MWALSGSLVTWYENDGFETSTKDFWKTWHSGSTKRKNIDQKSPLFNSPKIQEEIKNSALLKEALISCAIDEKHKVVYISIKEQRDWKYSWRRFNFLVNPTHLRSIENINLFAKKKVYYIFLVLISSMKFLA